jgi:hypothetical protein
MAQQAVNDNLVLVVGKSAAGKSASLMGLNNGPNPQGVMYLNCEAGKKLPFRSKFKEYVITDPLQINEAFDAAETMPQIHTIVVDTLTYLLDMFESIYVINSANTMKAWAHTAETLNENEMAVETKVPVKGSLKSNGIESYFSLVIASKKLPLKSLKDYGSDLLTVSPEEEALGFKYVYQTKLTKETVNERLRGPMGMFSTKETFIDNDIQLVLNRLHEYYA